ncbi:MAG TPA: L-tyrosine/L-tryptophan isonitrile synthase family protein, partial [Methylomirabilota bacterium]|nr:L-tyrosine/L-tryptophan isonitrile synthase family protein [Methylomirabilota bacterium]
MQALGPLLPREPVAGDAFRGRRHEYEGRDDPRRDEIERTTTDLEGLVIREARMDPAAVLDRITPGLIAQLVEAAILQSAPERAVAEMAGAAGLVHPPPAPVARVRVPALSLRPLVEAVDADARRFAHDPDQRLFRATALLATDAAGRAYDREASRRVAEETAELDHLEQTPGADVAAQRRRDALVREHRRRARYARAFALAARQLAARETVQAPLLYRAFEAVAGLDKAPFRRGPSEHLTAELLAGMAVQFYRALTDPSHVVTFVLLTFPIKNSSGLRTNVATEAADAGELLMLAQLRRLLQFLGELGLPRVRFVCLTDGIVYSRYLGPYDRLQAVYYRENVRKFRDALGLAGRVVIADADPLLQRLPRFEAILAYAHAMLARAEREHETVRRKLLSLTRSFMFHIHARDADTELLARIVNASLRGQDLEKPPEAAEQQRMWVKAVDDARWYAAHLVTMAAVGGVTQLIEGDVIRAT